MYCCLHYTCEMDFKRIEVFNQDSEELDAAIAYVGRHRADMQQGNILLTCLLKQLHDRPKPYVIIFDEFHFKHVKNSVYQKWRALVAGVATVDGTFTRIVHIQVVCIEMHLSGGAEMANGLITYLVGAVADQNGTNTAAKSWLTGHGCAVVYDHRHLCSTLARAGYCDALLRHLYRSEVFSQETFAVWTNFARYFSVETGNVSLTNVNADLLEDIGKKWASVMANAVEA
ncbi:uncharacterized protein [Drosophila takahashii]|uniref:uncharacterized protein n=1 Tax=Drosophila takahashii TaxID=29030 RepID=UPI003898D94F